MLIRHHMIPLERNIEIAPTASLREAVAAMDAADVRGLLVPGHGVISHHDISQFVLQRHLAGEGLGEARVQELTRRVAPVRDAEPIENAIGRLILDTRVLPVVNAQGKDVGLLTWFQVNSFIFEILGYNDPQYARIHTDAFEAPGSLAQIVDVIARTGGNIGSIYLSSPKVANLRHVVVRVDREHRAAVERALVGNGHRLLFSDKV